MKKTAKEKMLKIIVYGLALLLVIASLAILLLPGGLINKLFIGWTIGEGYECGDYSFSAPSNAVSSSSYANSYNASKAIDGNRTTLWVSNSGEIQPHWIYFDLGGKKCINSVELFIDSSYLPITLDVQVSDDASIWSNVASDWRISRGNIYLQKSFSEAEGRYIRIYEKQNTESSGPAGNGTLLLKYGSLSEIRISSAVRKLIQASGGIISQEQYSQNLSSNATNNVTNVTSNNYVNASITNSSGVFCVDSDKGVQHSDGKNLLVRGISDGRAGGAGLFEDRCVYKEQGELIEVGGCEGEGCALQEGFCTAGRVNSSYYSCINGCIDGACLDSDEGLVAEEIAEGDFVDTNSGLYDSEIQGSAENNQGESGGSLFEKEIFTFGNESRKNASSKNESAIGFWATIPLDIRLTIIFSILAVGIIFALVVAYLLMPRE